jgi:hypothetical protein
VYREIYVVRWFSFDQVVIFSDTDAVAQFVCVCGERVTVEESDV